MNESQVLGRRHLDKKGQPEQSGPDPASLECCVITDNGEIRYITSRSSSIVLQWRRPHDENSFSSTIYRTHALTHPPHLSFSELGEHPASWEPAQRFFGAVRVNLQMAWHRPMGKLPRRRCSRCSRGM
jgi:hypothetical protein